MSEKIQAEAAVGENPADYPQTPDELKRWIIQRAQLHLTYSGQIAKLNEQVEDLTDQRRRLAANDGVAQLTLLDAIREYQDKGQTWIRQYGSRDDGGYVQTAKPMPRFVFSFGGREYECFMRGLDDFKGGPHLVIQEVVKG